ncbi:MAG: ferritin family protein [Planctomycetes bacterium]|nr:ferritin family protein [Planctomycetota bacterium]
MDILEFALEKEKISEESYRELARRAENSGLKKIFIMLADEEAGHSRVIEGIIQDISPVLVQTQVLAKATNIFKMIRNSVEEFDFATDELEVYRQARDREAKSRDFYQQKSEEVEDSLEKEIFARLAGEEEKHYILLDNICDFVSEPECYLEDAEFVHLQDYQA